MSLESEKRVFEGLREEEEEAMIKALLVATELGKDKFTGEELTIIYSFINYYYNKEVFK